MDALLPRLDPLRKTQLLICKATWSFNHSDYGTQVVLAEEAVEVAAEHGLTEAEGEARLTWGKGLTWSGQHAVGRDVLEGPDRGPPGRAAPAHRRDSATCRSSPTTRATSPDR